ncbi:Nitrate reductase [Pseudoruegeria aquimaris]|uniref:Nitrate reductase n=1 Tax=Pseudoruegeria aquimaris TaxID=393663 RepID=A0A1Y5RE11_9RHOB|nr:nitrate reductase [Pseudoruegeria aquimaris]SLN15330.1 Nitrate reductase [Pseudoruegeria aquimaris]
MTAPTCTTCPYCGVGCGVIAPQAAGGAVAGDPAHPANFGRLCSKGSALGETLDLEGRLLAPQIAGRDASWEEALDLVAGKFAQAVADHGPDSVALYVSGQLLTEDYYVANKLMKGYIGSANIDTNSRLCMASSVAGHKRAFGTDTVPGTYEDLEEADVLVLVGSNLAWCHPVLFQRVAAAKAARPQMKVINVDPRRTATSDLADLHLAIRPDGDAALFNGLLAEIADRGAVNAAYVSAHVNGFDTALAAARASDPRDTGLTADELAAFHDLWIGSEKVVTVYSQGVNQSACGTDKVNAILNCHLATGRIGRPGMGPFSVTGQPNAMGGREVGGLANMLANHLDIENEAHRAALQGFWNSPTMAAKPGLKAVDLFRACADGRIKALWVISTNPAVSLPEAEAVAEAIRSVPFTVASDITAATDTNACCDVLLPATGWGEKSGTVTNSERRISRQRPFLPAPGAARPDWAILCDVAGRMGFEGFDYADESEIFAEYAASTALARDFGKDLDLTGLAGLSKAEYDALAPVQWPVPETGAPGGRFFAQGGFFHPDGKARMLPITPPAHGEDTHYPFRLNTGRIRDQWHTMTRTGKTARLSSHLAEPFAEIHPEDAIAHGIHDADLVDVTSPTGTARVRALLTTRVQRGAIFLPMHWTASFSAPGKANPAVAGVTDPVSGQPALKGSRARISRFAAAWYGFAVSVNRMQPDRPYWAVARCAGGWRAEVAGLKTPADWEAEARRLLGLSGGTATLLEDPATGTARVAIEENGRIAGLFFAARQPVAVARSHAARLLGSETSPLKALAGRAGSDRPDPGATVCSCFEVGINTLKLAIQDGATTVASLGERTCAGTNCGSCKPELQALIDAGLQKVAAE